VFIAHDRRELVHVNVTDNPTAAWVWRQLIEASPLAARSRALCCEIGTPSTGITFVRVHRASVPMLLPRWLGSPRANAIAERVIGTLGGAHVTLCRERKSQVTLT
jgi:hypothetical protein